jgi:hypothetical protein
MSPKQSNDKTKRRFGPGGDQNADNGIIDASPGDAEKPKVSPQKQLSNITESQAWRQTSTAANQMWARYLAVLRESFKRMPREQQDQYISNGCRVFCVGLTVLGLCYVYPLLPLFTRVWLVPLVIIIAWWPITRVFTTVVTERWLLKYLNQEF